ncbi:MAG: glycine cleavage system protein GcvH [Nitrososphaerota archaeon]
MKVGKYEIREDLLYTKDHEWIKIINDNESVVGITDYAADMLHDIVFVSLPEEGSEIKQGAVAATVESVKSTADVMIPLSGRIILTNKELLQHPEKVNQSPYEDGWFFRLKPYNTESEKKSLLTPSAYADLIQHLTQQS